MNFINKQIVLSAVVVTAQLCLLEAVHLRFVPFSNYTTDGDENEGKNTLQINRSLISPSDYGYFQVSYYPPLCIDIPGTKVQNRKKLKFKRCQPGKESQLWRMDDNCHDKSALEGYELCGKVHSRFDDDMCIQVRKGLGHRARLFMNSCRENMENQIWVYDSDCLSPSGDLDMTATTWRKYGAKGGDPVLLEKCGGNSLDFGEIDDWTDDQ